MLTFHQCGHFKCKSKFKCKLTLHQLKSECKCNFTFSQCGRLDVHCVNTSPSGHKHGQVIRKSPDCSDFFVLDFFSQIFFLKTNKSTFSSSSIQICFQFFKQIYLLKNLIPWAYFKYNIQQNNLFSKKI